MMIEVSSCGASAPSTRRTTANFLAAQRAADEFGGLGRDPKPLELLDDLRRGRRVLKLDARLFDYLEYLIRKTQPCDWEGRERPIVWQSVAKTARAFSVTSRTIQNIERRLNEEGWITWSDSGNHRRGGYRDDHGRIVEAWGVDLSPLGERAGEIRKAARDAEEEAAAWFREKRKWQSEARLVRALLEFLGRIDSLPAWVRTRISEKMPLDDLRGMVIRITALRRGLQAEAEALAGLDEDDDAVDPGVGETPPDAAADSPDPVPGPEADPETPADVENPRKPWGKTPGFSPRGEQFFRRQIQYTKPLPESFGYMYGREGAEEPARRFVDCGLDHITAVNLQEVASRTVSELLPRDRPASGREVVEAGRVLRGKLGIRRDLWAQGVRVIGPVGMAVLLIVTCIRHETIGTFDRKVRNPGGFVRGCLRKAENGELNLHGSIFGMLGDRRVVH